MPQCVFKNCKNNYRNKNVFDGISYFRFPSDPFQCIKWSSIVAKERQEDFFKPRKYSVVCSIHFEESDILGNLQRRRLTKTAIPKFNNSHVSDLEPDVEPNADRDMVISKIYSLSGSSSKEKKKDYNSFNTEDGTFNFLDEQEEVTIKSENMYEQVTQDEDITWDGSNSLDRDSLPENSDFDPLNRVQSPCTLIKSENDFCEMATSPEKRHCAGLEDEHVVTESQTLKEEEEDDDEHVIFGRHVANKLRSLPKNQRIYLEKIIIDAIFEAELGNLSKESSVICSKDGQQ